jgi:hypothetical protein
MAFVSETALELGADIVVAAQIALEAVRWWIPRETPGASRDCRGG